MPSKIAKAELVKVVAGKKGLGYKIVVYNKKAKMLESMMDNRAVLPLKKGFVINDLRGHYYLGNTIEYVMTYYAGDPEDYELDKPCFLLTFEFDYADVSSGDPESKGGYSDGGDAFTVKKCKLIHALNLTENIKVF